MSHGYSIYFSQLKFFEILLGVTARHNENTLKVKNHGASN